MKIPVSLIAGFTPMNIGVVMHYWESQEKSPPAKSVLIRGTRVNCELSLIKQLNRLATNAHSITVSPNGWITSCELP